MTFLINKNEIRTEIFDDKSNDLDWVKLQLKKEVKLYTDIKKQLSNSKSVIDLNASNAWEYLDKCRNDKCTYADMQEDATMTLALQIY